MLEKVDLTVLTSASRSEGLSKIIKTSLRIVATKHGIRKQDRRVSDYGIKMEVPSRVLLGCDTLKMEVAWTSGILLNSTRRHNPEELESSLSWKPQISHQDGSY